MYICRIVCYRGDHTFTDLSLLVLPPHTNVVLFSIDGSFTASVSIMGKDPKVRPGAVDVVRCACINILLYTLNIKYDIIRCHMTFITQLILMAEHFNQEFVLKFN